MELLIVTGMSGAGKSQIINALEDIGFYCVDNIPGKLIGKFIELCSQSGGKIERVAIVADVRSKGLFDENDSFEALSLLAGNRKDFKILFVDAADKVLLRRYKETRRVHPLLDERTPTIEEAIVRERKALEEVREMADYVIDTSHTSNSQLKESVCHLFLSDIHEGMVVNCMSFGYKYGIPTEADLVFDVRCLPNPFYVPELRNKTGLDKEVSSYVMQWEQAKGLVPHLFSLLDYLLPLYLEEGKSQLILAMGCTGGKHRSVTFAELLAEHIREKGYKSIVSHRDIQKPSPT